jgi:hypothetical protein
MSCPQHCNKFDNTKKFYASLSVGLIALIVFLVFSSKWAYQLTGHILDTYEKGSDGATPTTTGLIVHGVVAGLVAVGLGFLIMMPWKKAKCVCPM